MVNKSNNFILCMTASLIAGTTSALGDKFANGIKYNNAKTIVISTSAAFFAYIMKNYVKNERTSGRFHFSLVGDDHDFNEATGNRDGEDGYIGRQEEGIYSPNKHKLMFFEGIILGGLGGVIFNQLITNTDANIAISNKQTTNEFYGAKGDIYI